MAKPTVQCLDGADPSLLETLGDMVRREHVVVVRFGCSQEPTRHLEMMQEAFGSLMKMRKEAPENVVVLESAGSSFADRARHPATWPTNQSPHADGWYLEHAPRVVGQLCTTNAEVGGESTFVSARAMLRALRARFSEGEIRPLWQHDAAVTTIAGRAISRPVFTKRQPHPAGSTRVACTFSCDEFNRVTPSGTALPAFDFCREFVRLRDNHSVIKLRPGDGVFVANASVLNGRRGWSDNRSGSRRFIQVWYDGAGHSALEGFIEDEVNGAR